MKLWVLIANSSFAEIFAVEKNGREIHRVQEINFPEGRERSGSILSDKPGRGFEGIKGSGNFGRHAYSSEVDIHMHEQQVFAHKIAEILSKAKGQNAFEQLAIISPPQFLGELRLALSDAVRKSIYKEINKDIPESKSEQDRIQSICRFLELKRPASAPS